MDIHQPVFLAYTGFIRSFCSTPKAACMPSKKLDYKKDFKQLYFPPTEPVFVDVPEMKFLAINGKGYPNQKGNGEFQQAIQALYGIAYTMKFTLKFKKIGQEYTIPPLDSLWWMQGGGTISKKRLQDWRWTLMIPQPDFITKKYISDAILLLKKRGKTGPFGKVQFKKWKEGRSAQLMHIGPYDKEGPSINKLLAFIKEKKLKVSGKHHEIYLSDPRRVAPSKLKTVIRYPVKKTS